MHELSRRVTEWVSFVCPFSEASMASLCSVIALQTDEAKGGNDNNL